MIKQFYILSFFVLNSIVSYCHTEIFNISDGVFNPDVNFDKNFSFDLLFKKDVFIDEIGVDFIDLGPDNFANLEIKIYCKDSLIFCKKERFSDNFNQIAYFTTNKVFQADQKYSFLIINLDLYSSNDNKISLFTPNFLPYNESTNTFTTIELGSSVDTLKPFSTSSFCPFIHIGATTQNGIYFSNLLNYVDFSETPSNFSRSSRFKLINENILIDGVGFSFYDTGIDNESTVNISIYDPINNTVLFSKDTLLKNHHKSSFYMNAFLELEKNKEYIIKSEFYNTSNEDDLVTTYKPIYLPCTDITNYSEIIEFYKNDNIDTVGLPFALSFNEKKLNIKNHINDFTLIDFDLNRNIKIELTQLAENINEIELYSMVGNKITSNFARNSIFEFEIIDPVYLKGFYILNISLKDGVKQSKVIQL